VAAVADKLSILNSAPISQTWLTVAEAAAYLKVKPRTLLLWVRQHKVKAFALSGTKRHVWRFRPIDLDAMLTGPAVLNEGRLQ
jgi:excisionase family DNA binding protein